MSRRFPVSPTSFLNVRLPPRGIKPIPNLEKRTGHFHCPNCRDRFSADVWVTQRSRRVYQSVECPSCYSAQKPYYVGEGIQKQTIFNRIVHTPRIFTKKGAPIRISPYQLRKMGY